MTSKYQESERSRGLNLITDNNPVFYGGKGGKYYRGENRDFILTDFRCNLYAPIRKEAIEYFKKNGITWWGGKNPTGHILSSQIACVNHLYALRQDKETVLSLIKSVSKEFVDVIQIGTDKFNPAYIQFESVSDRDFLNEGTPTRGNNCTSIDALIYALHENGTKWLLPIEWKYTEHYGNTNKAEEGCQKNPENCKGKVRKGRYRELIDQSLQLKNEDHYCYYFEPFYQLMRQTLWAEKMVKNKVSETTKADNYLHLHVIPDDNLDLLRKKYKCSGLGMESTWRKHLIDSDKYKIISPEKLFQFVNRERYLELINYLQVRYWNR